MCHCGLIDYRAVTWNGQNGKFICLSIKLCTFFIHGIGLVKKMIDAVTDILVQALSWFQFRRHNIFHVDRKKFAEMLRNKSGNKSWNIYSSCNVLINVVNISADPLVDIFCQTSKERIFCRKNRRIEFHLLRMFKLQWADQNIRIFLHNSFLCLDDLHIVMEYLWKLKQCICQRFQNIIIV